MAERGTAVPFPDCPLQEGGAEVVHQEPMEEHGEKKKAVLLSSSVT